MISQVPEPGTSVILHQGDVVTFTVSAVHPVAGTSAWLRTNLGRAAIRRREILAHAEAGEAILGRDWHDIAMRETSSGQWVIKLSVPENGA